MNETIEKDAPANATVECAVLACVVLDDTGACYLQAAQRLSAEDFYLRSHQVIFKAMVHLSDSGTALDYNTIASQLTSTGELQAAGGDAYVTDLFSRGRYPRLKNISHYIDILLGHSAQREIISTSTSAAARAADYGEPADIAGELQERLDQITRKSQGNCSFPASTLAPEVAETITRQHYQQRNFIGLPSGIEDLDYMLCGLVKGENIVVAADTGAGKTSFAMNVARVNCLADNPVHIFSLEQKRDQLILRLAADLSGINHMRIRNTASLTQEELKLVVGHLEEIAKWPLWIDDTANLAVRELHARGRMQIAKGAKLLIVDFLQKLRAPGDTLRERVNNASEGVRELAKVGDVPILNLSQLSRPERGTSRKPGLHDLKESGNIEQDAHAVCLLWREESDNSNDTTPSSARYTGKGEIIVAKNRNGPTGTIAVHFNAQLMRWYQGLGSIS